MARVSRLSDYFLNYTEQALPCEGKPNLLLVTFHKSEEWKYLPRQCVLKKIPGSQTYSQNEGQIHQILSQRVNGIVRLHYQARVNQELHLFIEFCTSYNLAKVIEERARRNEPWTEPELRTTFLKLVTVLAHIHKLNYCHRDVKPDNIFVHQDGSLKIGDFGDAALLANSADSLHGTKAYMDPTLYFAYFHGVLKGEINYMKSDVFALGKVFYEMMTLKCSANFEDFLSENEEMFRETVRRTLGQSKFVEIVLGMLRFDSKERWSSAQCLEALLCLQESAFIYEIEEFPEQDQYVEFSEEEFDEEQAGADTIVHFPRD